MGPTCVLSAPGGPHVGLMNLAIWVTKHTTHYPLILSMQMCISVTYWQPTCISCRYWNSYTASYCKPKEIWTFRALFLCIFVICGLCLLVSIISWWNMMTILMYSKYHECYKSNVVRHNTTYSPVNMPKEQVANKGSPKPHPQPPTHPHFPLTHIYWTLIWSTPIILHIYWELKMRLCGL